MANAFGFGGHIRMEWTYVEEIVFEIGKPMWLVKHDPIDTSYWKELIWLPKEKHFIKLSTVTDNPQYITHNTFEDMKYYQYPYPKVKI